MLKCEVITSGRDLFELEFAALVRLLLRDLCAIHIKELSGRTHHGCFRIAVNHCSAQSTFVGVLT